MICDILYYLPNNFLAIWTFIFAGAFITVFGMTSLCFRWLYVNVTYSKWQHKTNGLFPTVAMVREEILATMKAIACVSAWPAAAIYFRNESWTHGYCPADPGAEPIANHALPLWAQFLLIVGITDFYEFFYHWCGHWFDFGWKVHRQHHHYYNPTPFAVIADEPWDNIWRAFPLFALPLFFSMHLEVLWYTFLIFFYVYGIYLHCGYELDWVISTENPVVNTSFQHYIHHAAGTRKRPCHCGFFIKLWDQLWGSCYDGPACDAKAERAKGKRSLDEFDKLRKSFPNYALLWTSVDYWRDPVGFEKRGGKVATELR